MQTFIELNFTSSDFTNFGQLFSNKTSLILNRSMRETLVKWLFAFENHLSGPKFIQNKLIYKTHTIKKQLQTL